MYDLLIRNGMVVDGTGARPRVADVAVSDGAIVAVGPDIGGEAKEVVDAAGKLVTPGFIDVHTHYDGQVTWDDAMLPSAAQGVTTVLIGCCGIGFAPVRKGTEDWLIRLMEGVEDIPGAALHVGIPWGWESYPDYLDALEQRRYALNIAAHVPHSAVRAYVLGERAERDEAATPDDLVRISDIVRGAIAAGAVGVGTSRVSMHRGSDGGTLPGTHASEEELMAIGEAMRDAGGGVFQIIPSGIVGGVEGEAGEQTMAGLADRRDAFRLTEEIERMRRIHRRTGQPITFTFAESVALGPEEYQGARAVIAAIEAAGEKIYPQFAPRQVGALTTLDTYHAFTARPSYRAIAHLPVEARARRMEEPTVKAAILSEADLVPETDDPMQHMHVTMARNVADTYDLGPDLDFEPEPSQSIKARAEAEGRDPLELLYDLLIADGGRRVLFFFATNYVDGHLGKIADQMRDPQFLLGLGDAGAHVCFICDAGFPTFTLAHWGKTRSRGETLPVELLVRRMTGDPARIYGLADRGVIAPGRRADLNVIDFDRLRLQPMRLASDLPTGAKRFLQGAVGYELTVVDGVVTRRDDQDTGARPGRLIRRRPDAAVARGDALALAQ